MVCSYCNAECSALPIFPVKCGRITNVVTFALEKPRSAVGDYYRFGSKDSKYNDVPDSNSKDSIF